MKLDKFLTRKFVAATGASALMAACWVASEWMPNARQELPSLLTAIVGAVGAYITGNVLQDHVLRPKTPEEKPYRKVQPEAEDPAL